MKKITGSVLIALAACFFLCCAASALTSRNLNDGVVGYEQGYFVGTFYKEVSTGKVWKVLRVTKDTIYITDFDSGHIEGK